ncbi:Os03g0721550 [Oryza sativa Japonica Group]|jgi:hypothetical protein|uniref:Uncharacterized protein n=5 Tax=Oryza TaxID=4527 RepID=A0A8J8YG40_ORYSJ|nr:hypothetical protein [Oryza sativa Japonica Group]EAY91687.1 hypothetical protein OsI_13326 [Oryza sativa Indica Group]AAX95701.1 hypothetical protein [Oryza sativa Japonica Group]ABF98592.1 expressed protein [Oryza sativa Japonica Group]EAZ28406.1 hypothetical protein OsJ_12386 [Oryza sativa Japonica Group]
MKQHLRETLAKAARHVEKTHHIRMEYEERVLRRFVLHGYVDVTDNEDDQVGDDDDDDGDDKDDPPASLIRPLSSAPVDTVADPRISLRPGQS